VRVTLGKFARTGIEAFFGSDVPAGVHAALVHYLSRLRSGPAPLRLPRGWPPPQAAAEAGARFEVAVESDLEQRFEHESRRQEATVEGLVAHAVLVYLADVDRAASKDAGRATLKPASW
jgi:hypothetical protein